MISQIIKEELAMSKINLGKVAMTPKGEWDAGTTYERLDVVSYKGSSFTVLKTCTGEIPVEGEFYALLASKGDRASDETISVSWYISPTGNDISGDGSLNNPWGTIQHAIDQIKNYHSYVHIIIESGVYNEKLEICNQTAYICLESTDGNMEEPNVGNVSINGIEAINCSKTICVKNITIPLGAERIGIALTNVTRFHAFSITVDGSKVASDVISAGVTLNNSTGFFFNMCFLNCTYGLYQLYGCYCIINGLSNNGVKCSGNSILFYCHSSLLISRAVPQTSMADTLYVKEASGLIFAGGGQVGDTIEEPVLSSNNCVHQGAFANEHSYITKIGNIVIGNLSIKFNADFSKWTNILVIPAGYRPLNRYKCQAFGASGKLHTLDFYGTGDVQCEDLIPTGTLLSVCFTYYTA